jgi:phosphoglycerate dehydrogenase-like enzyme
MKILLPDTIALDEVAAPQGDTLVLYDVRRPVPAEHRDAEVLVVWRNAAENLADAARELNRLQLVQTLAAGPDAVLDAGFATHVALSSGRSLHDATVAEHSLALVLAVIRRLDHLRDAQREGVWDEAFLQAQRHPATEQLYTLAGASVCLWGFGSVARKLAPMLELLGAHVTGVASSAGERDGYRVVDDGGLAEHLGGVDVLVSLLPSTPKTQKAFDRRLLDALKPGAVFVNVGRGATVDEAALVEALVEGRLRAAALDVMAEEPPGAGSPLWNTPNLLITPHAAGNRPRGAAALVTRNLEALHARRAILNAVART